MNELKYIVNTGFTNHQSKRIANAQARGMRLKSAVSKRIDRPHRVEMAVAGHAFIGSFLSRFHA